MTLGFYFKTAYERSVPFFISSVKQFEYLQFVSNSTEPTAAISLFQNCQCVIDWPLTNSCFSNSVQGGSDHSLLTGILVAVLWKIDCSERAFGMAVTLFRVSNQTGLLLRQVYLCCLVKGWLNSNFLVLLLNKLKQSVS